MADSETESARGGHLESPSADRAHRPAATTVIAVLLLVFALHWAEAVVLPVVLAILLRYALDPVHRRIVAAGVPRHLAAALVVLLTVAGLVWAGATLRGQAIAFVNKLPMAAGKVHEWMADRGTASAVVTMQQAALELKKAADQSAPARERGVTRVQVEEPVLRVTDLLWQGSLSAIALACQAAVILLLAYYMLANGDRYKRKILRVAGPSLTRRRVTLEILNQISAQIERFFAARVVLSVTVGAATGLAFWALGAPQPAIWGVGAGVLNTVPYIGPGVIAVAAGILGLAEFHTLGMAALLAGVATAIATLEGLLVAPWLMGRAGRMNAGAVFVGLTFWGWIWGTCGLLLAVPILMVIKAICDHIEGGAAISELLGE